MYTMKWEKGSHSSREVLVHPADHLPADQLVAQLPTGLQANRSDHFQLFAEHLLPILRFLDPPSVLSLLLLVGFGQLRSQLVHCFDGLINR